MRHKDARGEEVRSCLDREDDRGLLRTRALPCVQDSLGAVRPNPTDKRAKLGDSEELKVEVIIEPRR